MRNILFRGKRIDSGEWTYGFYAHAPNGRFGEDEHMIQTVNENGRLGMLHDVIPETVGQYTGLTDINGKKIFEGDIVKNLPVVHDEEVQIKSEIFSVEFRKGCWVINNDSWDFLGANAKGLEVIGNIHDKESVDAK